MGHFGPLWVIFGPFRGIFGQISGLAFRMNDTHTYIKDAVDLDKLKGKHLSMSVDASEQWHGLEIASAMNRN